MKTEAQARHEAQAKADLMHEPVVVFRDNWHWPNIDYGHCCLVVWERVQPTRNLEHIETVQPCPNV